MQFIFMYTVVSRYFCIPCKLYPAKIEIRYFEYTRQNKKKLEMITFFYFSLISGLQHAASLGNIEASTRV